MFPAPAVGAIVRYHGSHVSHHGTYVVTRVHVPSVTDAYVPPDYQVWVDLDGLGPMEGKTITTAKVASVTPAIDPRYVTAAGGCLSHPRVPADRCAPCASDDAYLLEIADAAAGHP